ncbi:conserved Plasmodium protein, unknown function [Plasmodium malariae]|nr:conserved Plasmodium protein, unknown function [Plasmodium malariae]
MYNPLYYPLGVTWKYVLSSKSTGCFGSSKKYTVVPAAYHYPSYYYVYYYPCEVSKSSSSDNAVKTDKKKEKEVKDNETKEEEAKEETEKVSKKEVAKREYVYIDRGKWIRIYVEAPEPYYFASSLYVPYTYFFP